ncbi:DUF3572 domain-containing protein [Sulfitobacter pseudonitzschiae]|uniref:DUF3572 domain-containing protein n=1 Tax=Pseudosulfitobacter pseudonitzschiae TaxID=1402135 RepID=A0A9Q2NRV0_9RHOB|nr:MULTISPECIES: DUF3572 domain-containing protein [Roseobacteraceae]MBM2294538.1 DUF3572 domain-containing protein [Pseudosulfitobacter pseudonitzschiae]MBM2299352.1 DUF3572 domain-containing protein [Pseudosulfitobacter pseudonitzschiae]MBM2304404.1 DUF3572 domain-containing protein [Pseudosulfitobacter pseudonitzschiae]MBM2314150.1 DUF3572 domain-containing protein [Pseudosulfitobacter pseudonitzschiae]MBM2319065.1 DUF3572 domain-containing protein [Pseudosulfitobacter pseudonitzschiae]|tara:strand:- start:3252 stop:3539 length:288 start_codon:yes stop_codon:yes gene_type:complete
MKMTKPNSAETVALQALAWLAGNEELLPVFQGASGAGADDLRNGATDPAFLGSVLDFVMMDDVWVVAFCDSAGLSYDTPMRARAALPGGEQVNWT